MSFLVPAWLGIATAAAAVVVGLHLLTRVQPRPRPLPTARFVPEQSLRALARAARPTDLMLLAIRVLALLLVGASLARPVFEAGRRPLAVVALADVSPGADSVQVAARLAMQSPAPDTVIPMRDLSSGLIAARRAGTALGKRADSVDLVVVSALSSGLWDNATPATRRMWPGRIRIQPVARATLERPAAEVDAGPDDAVRAALDRLGRRATRGTVLVRRHRPSAADSARVAREGGVLLWWPAGAEARDTEYAVYSGDLALVSPLPRLTTFAGEGISQYANGEAAAVERPLGRGCEREVGFAIDAGDAALRPAGLSLIERLIAPCGAGWTPDRYQPLDSARLGVLAGTGPMASASRLRDAGGGSPATLPLLLAGLALAVERVVRRRAPA